MIRFPLPRCTQICVQIGNSFHVCDVIPMSSFQTTANSRNISEIGGNNYPPLKSYSDDEETLTADNLYLLIEIILQANFFKNNSLHSVKNER